ncbi:uncharacterized protein LOC122373811 [Amphibalanus amphitrite]|uniref:uncharacterized protein LOC122373811 n=1 Tax=Amphibalanus amphitrite TaxID=1232801 RepID=UPI001C911324|nr:uncharacterized protein LOC122373811 [Amphibalanus amphitrite]
MVVCRRHYLLGRSSMVRTSLFCGAIFWIVMFGKLSPLRQGTTHSSADVALERIDLPHAQHNDWEEDRNSLGHIATSRGAGKGSRESQKSFPPFTNTFPVAAKDGNARKMEHNPLSCFTNRTTPSNQRLFTEKEKAMFRYLFDWPEIPTSSCKRMLKMGGLASGKGCLTDGDKHVCLDEPLSLATAHDDCLIYSFGINYDWSFDEAARAFGCEVHSFDPSIDYPEGRRSDGITFHHFGIGRNNHTNVYGWQIYTLDQIMDILGHKGRTIHYLKMDAEGGEFDMMAQQLLDGDGEFVLDKVEQIGFEVHFKLDPNLEMAFYRRANRSVHALRQLGFNMVHWEYNKVVKERYLYPGVERPVSLLYEILLIKNGPDRWDRSSRGRRERQVIAALAKKALTLTRSLVAGQIRA